MRSLWLAAAAAASGMSAPLTAASTALVPRSLGGAISRARLVGGSRRSRSAAAGSPQGFVLPPCTSSRTSTWGATKQEHATPAVAVTTAGSRRPRQVGRAPFWESLVARSDAAGVRSRSTQRLFSAQPAAASGFDSAVVEDGAISPRGSACGCTCVSTHFAIRAPNPKNGQVNLLEMSKEEVEQFLVGMGEPKFRAKQVLKWIFEGGAGSFEDMANIPKTLRAKLAEVATVGVLEVRRHARGIHFKEKEDGTKKLAYRLSDGQVIESVLMPYSDGRRTACISSQAGCAMGCVFCATGQMGFKRQLSSAEIFEQAYRFSQELQARGDRLSNVVFMGMGEPLANYKNVMEAVRRINTELGIGARHITISTVGLVPRIMRLSQEDIQVKLAVSLHAANDRDRGALLPVNRRFPLAELMEACREYVDVSGRRMTFEWALIRGENDSAEVASELGRLLRPLKGMCHVNIIPLNPTEGYKGGPSMAEAVNQFVEVLARNGVPATPRRERTSDFLLLSSRCTEKVFVNVFFIILEPPSADTSVRCRKQWPSSNCDSCSLGTSWVLGCGRACSLVAPRPGLFVTVE
ncbi:unnamed protein product [Scytosiphon promiscuus]